MDFTTVCRTCLGAKSLRSIFFNISEFISHSTNISAATGIKIEPNDGLPQNMCSDCVNCLNKSLAFQKKCKQSEAHLLEVKKCLNQTVSKSDSTSRSSVHSNLLNGNTRKQNIKRRKKSQHKDTEIEIFHEKDDKKEVDIKTEIIETKILDEQDSVNFKSGNKKRKKSLNAYIQKEPCILEIGIKLEPDEEIEEINQANLDDDDEPLQFLLDRGAGVQDNDTKDKKAHVSSQVVDNIKEELNTIIADKDTDLYNLNNTSRFLQDHNYFVSDDDARPPRVICQLCQQELSIRSIDGHMARRHPGCDDSRVKCELCDNYVLREKLKRHLKMMHSGDGYWCRYCKSEYTIKDDLVEHVKTCTAKKKMRKTNKSAKELGECDICHKTMQKASLRLHKNIKHSGLGPVCIHCGRRFGNKIRLSEHYRAKHGYEKFKCSHCDFQTASTVALQNHERRHRGEKPYMCEQCGASFHAAYLLAQHRQSHRTEKLVKCDQCPASFKANNSLHMHKMTCHSGALYRCTECPRAYSCRLYALKHLRLVHRIRGPVPPLQRLPTTLVSDEERIRSAAI